MLFIRLFIFFCSLLSISSFASLKDHFKKAANKSDASHMRNIDFIYTINLDERPLKFQSCTEQLHPYGIYPYRFSAVNGWKLSLEAVHDVALKFTSEMEGGFWGTFYKEGDNWTPNHEV